MSEAYLLPFANGRWAIGRLVEGNWIHLVQDSRLENPGDAEALLHALGAEACEANLDRYFPHRNGEGRCPTLDLLEKCSVLDPTNPIFKKIRTRDTGL